MGVSSPFASPNFVFRFVPFCEIGAILGWYTQVGTAFVMQYYEIMHKRPEHLHRFYHEISKVGRVGEDGVMRDFSTFQVSIVGGLAASFWLTEILLPFPSCQDSEITV